MSGLLALLDDVAAIAKLASTQIDDVVGQTAKAGSKAVGVVIDDAAMSPKFVHGLPAARELPIVIKIARGSLFNKLVILLPVALLLNAFLPQALTPLLMIGGFYLCFEGAEKIHHLLVPHAPESRPQQAEELTAARLEERRVKGAIKTDFILSAEIMTISLAAIESSTIWIEAVALAIVAVGITLLVYGAVAVLVKMDDVGLKLAEDGRLQATRTFGLWLVKAMPRVMALIATVGTAAMLWVGGNILTHGVHELGWHWPYESIHHVGALAGEALPAIQGGAAWLTAAAIDAVLGLAIGFLVMPVASHVIEPAFGLIARLRGKGEGDADKDRDGDAA